LNRANSIDISQFDYWTFGGEWVFALGDHFDGSLGGLTTRRPSRRRLYNINAATGTEIFCRPEAPNRPVLGNGPGSCRSATMTMEPYIGGGVNVYYWRYSENGQFVDYSNQPFGPCPPDIGCNLIPVLLRRHRGAVDRVSWRCARASGSVATRFSKSGIRAGRR
jgi:hypothetical protein